MTRRLLVLLGLLALSLLALILQPAPRRIQLLERTLIHRPREMDLAALLALPPPPDAARVRGWTRRAHELTEPLADGLAEGQTVATVGVVIEVTRELDGDVGLTLAGGFSVEAPDVPECMEARAAAARALGRRVRVVGQLLWDSRHGWWEIHPAVLVEVLNGRQAER